MPAKIYLRILQGGLLASLLIVFLVFKDLLFPFITSKQLTFNILMELLLAIWLVFIMRYPEYRPKISYITWGLSAYFLAVLASCAVSVDLGLSFWGDAERMLGVFHLLHFLIFYLILITAFRSWSEWRVLLFSSAGVATVVSYIGLSGTTFSTIGNTAYVSGYLIFNLFFLLILFRRSADSAWRWLYVLPGLIMLWEFWTCRTSGAIIGLFASLLLLFFLFGLFHKSLTVRRSAWLALLIAVFSVIFVFSQHQAAWFQKSFLKNLTFQKPTFQTRLISWRGAAADFKNHPLFGTGFGNYAITFDRHFDPKFFNYARTETYFDRAHNNLIDIASTTGLVGLLTYLSIFAAALYCLVREFKSGRRRGEVLVLSALLAAYFIQNLAVFDSFVTYVGLMILLGLIHWLPSDGQAAEAVETAGRKPFLAIGREWEWTALIILLFAAYLFAHQYNIKPWRMFQGVIDGYGKIIDGRYAAGVEAYHQALIGTPLDHDGAVTLINLVTINPDLLDSFTVTQAQTVLDYVISLAEKNVAGNPEDSLMQMQLAQVYDTAARFNYQDLDQFNHYSGLAIAAINRSLEASPGRVPVYLVKAQMQLVRGEKEEAIQTIEYAISLNPDYSEGYCRLAQFYIFLKDDQRLGEPLTKCVDLNGVNDINSGPLLLNALSHFTAEQDYPRALKLADRLAELDAANAQIWFNLAKLYLLSGENAKSQNALGRALDLDHKLQDSWAEFLDSLPGAASATPAEARP
ncbi:MAG: O-antigen ligase family protein [Patescibacteria group bacterium]